VQYTLRHFWGEMAMARKSLYSYEYEGMIALLRERRVSQAVTQVELAKSLRMTQGEVSKIESGQRRLDVVELRRWCGGLGVSFVGFVRELDRRLGG